MKDFCCKDSSRHPGVHVPKLAKNALNMPSREDSKKGIYVENVTEVEVSSARDVIQQLIQGAANRKVAATNMNRASSRSHSVFTCIIESKWESQGVTHHRFARLNLVDLAGSERQKSSGAEGERLKEATNINKSLSTLGLVIMNLVSISNGKSQHVPYRDSKLTFLLQSIVSELDVDYQDSLGGNAKTIIIANISPSSSCSLETLSTLKFAQRAKFIKNHAIVNEDASGDVLALRLENQNLKKEVSRLRSLLNGGAESHDGDALSITFPGSPGSFKWDGHHGFSSPLISEKKMPHLHKKEYEVALVGALRREKDKDTALQALAAENQAALQLAKQREDEIQGLKMRLRFREAGIKRLEAVASGKISAETHLLKEREEHLREIELLEALDWKLMHESEPANTQSDSNFLSSNQGLLGTVDQDLISMKSFTSISINIKLDLPIFEQLLTYVSLSLQEPSSPWRTSINEENEFLRMQAIQNQSELDSLRKRLDFCVGEKEKLERHVNDLAKELEAERLSKEALAEEAQKGQTKLLSLMNVPNVGQSETELKTMVDAIAAASQREAEAHEMAIFLSKENDELRMKLKVLIEDNNKLIDLYERAVAENSKIISDSSLNPHDDTIEDQNYHLTKVAEEKEQEMQGELEKLKCQLTEMHEENDKLLSLYEKAMQERDEFKRVIASGQHKNVDDEKGDFTCPEKLVEVDGGQCLWSCEASLSFENEYEREETESVGPHVVDENKDLRSEDHPVPISESLVEESCLYEMKQIGRHLQKLSGATHPNLIEQNRMEVDELNEPEEQEESYKLTVNTSIQTLDASAEPNEYDQDGHMNTVDPTAGTNLKIQENPPNTIAVHVCKDLSSIREKLVEVQEKLSCSAQTVTMFGSLERAMIEVDALSEKIGKLECNLQAKEQECKYLKALSSELQEKKDLANKKLSAIKQSLTSFSSSVSYFGQREALARSRFNASSEHLTRKKEELTRLQLSRQELMDALLKIKQAKTELEDSLENLRSKVEEENRKLESERVLFAIDNVEKPASELSQRNWQVTGNATALLKSEEEKTKLQNQIKLNKEKLRDVRKEAEAMTGKLGKIENEIQVLEVEVQKETLSVEEMNRKLQSIIQEKEMLLEVQKNGKDEFESMILEYHQSLFEADLKEEETKIMHEELLMESREIEGLQRVKAEATRRKAELVEAISCNTTFVSNKVEADLRNIQTSVVELNSMLEQCGSMESQFPVNL
ncbi:UNVERIFIED_CONTAM: Kinesin-like protein KIN-12E [Sesamum latifolium]|uniref:Kinesin-like protein KIN-12E n=1 Tax=Sesamum latifolium TaxID=2727402 RepID=A0AAW2Y510_9LAMI